MSEPTGQSEIRARWLLAAVLSWVFLRMALAPLAEGLWLDETGTAFVVREDASQVLARATRYQGQSPCYYLLAWASVRLLGWSEVALRLPSLLATLLAVVGLSWLARRTWGPEAGLVAPAVLAIDSQVSYLDGRPYGLALACMTLAAVALVRWVERPGLARALLYASCAGMSVWAHFLFGAALVAHVAWVLLERRSRQLPARQLALAAAVLAIFMAPCLSQLAGLWGRRRTLTFALPPSLDTLREALAPPVLLVGLAVGLVLAWLLRRARGESIALARPEGRSILRLALLWHVTPPVCLVAVSLVSGTSLAVARYWLSALPGTALLVAGGASSLRPRWLASVVAGGLALSALGSTNTRMDDWRWEIEQARPLVQADTPVLFVSGFIESTDPHILADPAWRSWLLAPLAAYPLPAGQVVVLPLLERGCPPGYLEAIAADLQARPRPALLLCGIHGRYALVWLEARLAPAGWTVQVERKRQNVCVVFRPP